MKLSKQSYKNFRQFPVRILQFGEGNFLRAFCDWIIDCMNEKTNFNTGVMVVQPLAHGMVPKLQEQDGLYTLYLNGIKDGQALREHRIINCIEDTVNPYTEYERYLLAAKNPELRFVISNTTEAGIAFDEKDSLSHQPPGSFPGKLTAFLFERYRFFQGDHGKGLIFFPCELIEKNGQRLKEAVLQYAALWQLGEDFINWIETANTFCNTLVDRIVPGFPRERIAEITEELGYEDALVVEGELFHLWVIEAPDWVKEEFPADQAGLNVLFVKDLAPYRTRKVRILNGAHTCMVPVGYLYGLETVGEVMEDPVVGSFVRKTVFQEIIPTIDLPEKELESFANAVMDRFRNPFIKHYLMSIALNSLSKFETRVLPTMLDYQKITGGLPKNLVFSLAALLAFYRGEYGGKKIKLADEPENINLLSELWMAVDAKETTMENLVQRVLAEKRLWKQDLNRVPGLSKGVADNLALIINEGMARALEEVIR